MCNTAADTIAGYPKRDVSAVLYHVVEGLTAERTSPGRAQPSPDFSPFLSFFFLLFRAPLVKRRHLFESHGVIDLPWSNLGKKDLMVSEPPARSSHRPPQPTILRLV